MLSNVCMLACSDLLQVDKYLKEILQDVISNLTNNAWRVRESRCMYTYIKKRRSSALAFDFFFNSVNMFAVCSE